MKLERKPYSSDKPHFKPKLVRRDKEGHYILIKRTIHHENLTACKHN
jgi:hypothetical protein